MHIVIIVVFPLAKDAKTVIITLYFFPSSLHLALERLSTAIMSEYVKIQKKCNLK